jgi:hypothetical protein
VPMGHVSWVLAGGPTRAEPHYQVEKTDLGTAIQPFLFPAQLHGYIYRDVAVNPDQPFGLVRHQVAWNNRFHLYLQDEARPHLFFYLPDSFKLARASQSPYAPLMTVKFRQSESDPTGVTVSFTYVALPALDAERIDAASAVLQSRVPPALLQANGMVFEPLLLTEAVDFRLTLPGQGAQPRPEALVSLRDGIQDTLAMSLMEFRELFEALFTSGVSLFHGVVNVTLDGELLPSIPLVANLADMVGPLFDSQEAIEADGALRVTLLNAIESPVRIDTLRASLRRLSADQDELIPATIQELTTPLQLASRASTSFKIVPQTPGLSGEVIVSVLDTSDVTVLPDRDAVLTAILDPTVVVQPVVSVTVQTVPSLFQPTSATDVSPIVAIQVLFESGMVAQFTAATCTPAQALCEQSLAVSLSLRDFIVGTLSLGTYRYKVVVIRADGTLQQEDGWQTSNQDRLFINAASLPGSRQ